MKTFLIIILCFASNVYASSSSSHFQVTGKVPLVLQTNVTRNSDLNYTVRELSNHPDGYIVTMETDAKSARYNGADLDVTEGQVTLTQVASQDKVVDTFKQLTFTTKPRFVRISIQVM